MGMMFQASPSTLTIPRKPSQGKNPRRKCLRMLNPMPRNPRRLLKKLTRHPRKNLKADEAPEEKSEEAEEESEEASASGWGSGSDCDDVSDMDSILALIASHGL